MKKHQGKEIEKAHFVKMGYTRRINQGNNGSAQDEQQKDSQAQDIQDCLKPQLKGHLVQELFADCLNPTPMQNKMNQYGYFSGLHTGS